MAREGLAMNDPIDLDAPWPNGAIRLWDSQWVNIVNGDCANPALAREEAINLAIKFTERAMRKNYEAELTARRAMDAEAARLIACELARIDGYDPEDQDSDLYDVCWSSGSNPEPLGDVWQMDYLPKGERIAAALLPFQRSDDKGDAT
jgi:hypothetical protein